MSVVVRARSSPSLSDYWASLADKLAGKPDNTGLSVKQRQLKGKSLMLKTFKSLAIGATLALTTLTTSVQADSDPTSVFNSHIQAFTTGDLEMAQANLTEETVLIIPGATYTGVAEFSEYITGQMQEFGQEGVVFEMGEMHVSGKVVYISWSAETPENSYIYATETYLIEDGKIAVQTVGWIKEPK